MVDLGEGAVESKNIPPCRGKVQTMVDELCRGLQEGQLMAAFQGLLALEPHVRNVAIGGIPFIPNLAEGQDPSNGSYLMVISLVW